MAAAVLQVVPKGGSVKDAEALIVLAEGWAVQMVPAARGYFPLHLSTKQLPDWGRPNAVLCRGKAVRDALHAHKPLRQLLNVIANTTEPDRRPLMLRLGAAVAENLPWEALCNDQDAFMALDPRWPIVRVSDPLDGQPVRTMPLRTPLRMLAVISARYVERQRAEFDALWAAVKGAREGGLPVTLHVLTGDIETRRALDEAVRGLPRTDAEALRVDGVPDSATGLVQAIANVAPNLLHFFCHGHAGNDPDDQGLEIASAQGLLAQNGTGLVRLRTARLVELIGALPAPWLLTLNCCSGGEGGAELLSIAHQAVGAAGARCPAAAAMTEPVDAQDAHRFSRAFYPTLFAGVARAQEQLRASSGPEHVEFDLAPAMRDARRALCEAHEDRPAQAREWMLPVLYLRGTTPPTLERPPAHPEGEVQRYQYIATLVAALLRDVRASLDEDGRRRLCKEGMADVPEDYWPDVNGNLSR